MSLKGIETFKQKLIEKGVYKNAIISNDWINCSSGYWVVTIPYGQKNGGTNKTFKRFSNLDVDRAVKFWNDNVEKGKVFNY